MGEFVKRIRFLAAGQDDPQSRELSEAADRIEYLERELSEERQSREMAAKKAWEFAARIRELEAALEQANGKS